MALGTGQSATVAGVGADITELFLVLELPQERFANDQEYTGFGFRFLYIRWRSPECFDVAIRQLISQIGRSVVGDVRLLDRVKSALECSQSAII